LIIIMIINWFGINWVAKTGLIFLSIVILSLVSMLIGLLGTGKMEWAFFKSNWEAEYSEDQNFFTMVAVFFPACTGIMSGAN